MTGKSRWIVENYIHEIYPKWDLSSKRDDQVYAIYRRLKEKPPMKETKAAMPNPGYHQMTIFEFLKKEV